MDQFPGGSIAIKPEKCPECGVLHNSTAYMKGNDDCWYEVAVSYRLEGGIPVNTGWYRKIAQALDRQKIVCNLCHHEEEFKNEFWGMEYDTNGNQKFRNIFIDGYFNPFE